VLLRRVAQQVASVALLNDSRGQTHGLELDVLSAKNKNKEC
jgi:hypothetical protein